MVHAIDLAPFADIIKAAPGQTLLDGEALLLARSGALAVHYAPFDHIERDARLVCVGITPGREQADNALDAYRQALRAGKPIAEALRHAKLVASFSGPMRSNIVRMLDLLGIHGALGAVNSAALFAPGGRVHFTSALRYPVFVNGKNYSGTPNMLRTPLLRDMVETFLAEEVRALPDALWLPLGPKPAAALRHLAGRGLLSANRILQGMPHPSGANAERIAYFLGLKAKGDLSPKTRPVVIDAAREVLLAQIGRLRSA